MSGNLEFLGMYFFENLLFFSDNVEFVAIAGRKPELVVLGDNNEEVEVKLLTLPFHARSTISGIAERLAMICHT